MRLTNGGFNNRVMGVTLTQGAIEVSINMAGTKVVFFSAVTQCLGSSTSCNLLALSYVAGVTSQYGEIIFKREFQRLFVNKFRFALFIQMFYPEKRFWLIPHKPFMDLELS